MRVFFDLGSPAPDAASVAPAAGGTAFSALLAGIGEGVSPAGEVASVGASTVKLVSPGVSAVPIDVSGVLPGMIAGESVVQMPTAPAQPLAEWAPIEALSSSLPLQTPVLPASAAPVTPPAVFAPASLLRPSDGAAEMAPNAPLATAAVAVTLGSRPSVSTPAGKPSRPGPNAPAAADTGASLEAHETAPLTIASETTAPTPIAVLSAPLHAAGEVACQHEAPRAAPVDVVAPPNTGLARAPSREAPVASSPQRSALAVDPEPEAGPAQPSESTSSSRPEARAASNAAPAGRREARPDLARPAETVQSEASAVESPLLRDRAVPKAADAVAGPDVARSNRSPQTTPGTTQAARRPLPSPSPPASSIGAAPPSVEPDPPLSEGDSPTFARVASRAPEAATPVVLANENAVPERPVDASFARVAPARSQVEGPPAESVAGTEALPLVVAPAARPVVPAPGSTPVPAAAPVTTDVVAVGAGPKSASVATRAAATSVARSPREGRTSPAARDRGPAHATGAASASAAGPGRDDTLAPMVDGDDAATREESTSDREERGTRASRDADATAWLAAMVTPVPPPRPVDVRVTLNDVLSAAERGLPAPQPLGSVTPLPTLPGLAQRDGSRFVDRRDVASAKGGPAAGAPAVMPERAAAAPSPDRPADVAAQIPAPFEASSARAVDTDASPALRASPPAANAAPALSLASADLPVVDRSPASVSDETLLESGANSPSVLVEAFVSERPGRAEAPLRPVAQYLRTADARATPAQRSGSPARPASAEPDAREPSERVSAASETVKPMTPDEARPSNDVASLAPVPTERAASTRLEPGTSAPERVAPDGQSAANAVERVQRVMDAVKLQIDRGNKVAELRVGEGGDAIRATIRVDQQRVTVHFVTADPAVRARLEGSLGTLARDLSSRGLELDQAASRAEPSIARPTTTVQSASESRSGGEAGFDGAGAFGREHRRERQARHDADLDDVPPPKTKGPHRTFVGRTYMT